MIIDEVDLELDEDVSLFQGRPFTGKARSYFPNGQVRKESQFREGFEEGICRERHENGALSREWNAVRGVAEGSVREWYEDGERKSTALYLRGVELSFDEWNKDGVLIEHREIDRQSELWKYVDNRLDS